jgi:hypothetical protein
VIDHCLNAHLSRLWLDKTIHQPERQQVQNLLGVAFVDFDAHLSLHAALGWWLVGGGRIHVPVIASNTSVNA